MKASIKVFGAGHVKTMLRNVARRVPEESRKQMHRAARHIVSDAKLMTPEDEGSLMESIRAVTSYGAHGRLQIDIVVGGESVIKYGNREVHLDQYAALVHEAYETQVAYVNGPGARTREKMAANPGVKIGSGFLTRAAEGQQERLERVIAEAITKVIASEV